MQKNFQPCSRVLIVLPALFLISLFSSCQSSPGNGEDHVHIADTVIQLVKFPKPTPVSNAERQRIFEASKAWYDATLANSVFNGGLLVAKGGNIIFEKYKGSNPFGAKDSMDKNTPIHIASVSKTFTGMAVLKLMEQGKLKIEDSFSKYFPQFNYLGVTIKTLLSHRSGIPNYVYVMDKMAIPQNGYFSNNDVLNVLINNKSQLPATAPPDTRFSYNNSNFALLALLIEKVSGKPYPKFMNESIFAPLGMTNTFVYTLADSGKASKNYDWRGREIPNNTLDLIYGDKNIYSTVEDLLKWDRALSKGLFLKKETLEAAYTPYSNEKPGVKNYGLGWRMDIFPDGKKLIFHTGWWHGNNALFLRLIPEDATIIVLNNRFTRLCYQAKWLANIFGQYFTAPPELDESVSDGTEKTGTGTTNNLLQNSKKNRNSGKILPQKTH